MNVTPILGFRADLRRVGLAAQQRSGNAMTAPPRKGPSCFNCGASDRSTAGQNHPQSRTGRGPFHAANDSGRRASGVARVLGREFWRPDTLTVRRTAHLVRRRPAAVD